MTPLVDAFHDKATGTISYIVHAGRGSACAVIDCILDFDLKSGRTSTASLDRLIERMRAEELRLEWILETHVHADHLSGAAVLKERAGGRIAIGAGIEAVEQSFAPLFGKAPGPPPFDRLLADGDRLALGALEARIVATPGHTPACIAYVIGDAAFVGDTIFMPDGGTARCDFPGGDPRTLYRSIRRLLELPAETRLFICHDYGPGGRAPAWQTTVAEQRQRNIHVHDGVDEAAFATMRGARDKTLDLPTLLIPAVQVNLRAGRLPEPEPNGVRYLKVPVNAL
jgi:glyoxylase-like metal-dependent hydrolase (beta-lactamase superfamily II)